YHGIAIALYLLVMLLIGWYGYKKTTDLDDYMLGGRNLGALVTALSAGAADMSGWLIMGLPGEIYEVGLSALWIAIGLTIGAFLLFMHHLESLQAESSSKVLLKRVITQELLL